MLYDIVMMYGTLDMYSTVVAIRMLLHNTRNTIDAWCYDVWCYAVTPTAATRYIAIALDTNAIRIAYTMA